MIKVFVDLILKKLQNVSRITKILLVLCYCEKYIYIGENWL